jgi:hypothetical protein
MRHALWCFSFAVLAFVLAFAYVVMAGGPVH